MKSRIAFTDEQLVANYPCLKISKESGLIVLFTSSTEGVVVSPNDRWAIGHSSDCWSPTSFQDFTGELTLSN